MSAKKSKETVSIMESDAIPGLANVYESGALVATLRKAKKGWQVAFYRADQDADGRSVWTPAPEREPVSLPVAADLALQHIAAAEQARAAA